MLLPHIIALFNMIFELLVLNKTSTPYIITLTLLNQQAFISTMNKPRSLKVPVKTGSNALKPL